MTAKEPSSENYVIFGDFDERISFNRAWFGVMRAHRKLYPRIAKALKNCGVNDPIWYEILLEVERSGKDGQPMLQLEEKLHVPQYALSRHISRLEKEGYLRREFIAEGRRKQILFLTEKGAGAHLEIWPVYVEAMQSEFSAKLSPDEAYELSRLLMKLLP